ncbi:MAG: hypothetical protein R2911_15465 [Caldilineaceae bacterium]
MQFKYTNFIAGLLVAALLLAGCGQAPEETLEEESPATVEHFESGPIASRITLTEDVANRIDIQTVAVSMVSEAVGELMIPYAAVLYDVDGSTWAYTNPAPLTYERAQISVEDVQDDMAIVSDGLTADASVVTVGATELYGSESEFEEE